MQKPLVFDLFLIASACAAQLFFRVDFALTPLEDAAMLMRYGQNLGLGHGFVYNPTGPAADGATDFLTAVALGGLVKTGLGIETATRFLIVVAHWATAFFLFFSIKNAGPGRRFWALFAAVFFAFGNGASFVSAFFAAPVFAFSAAVAWHFAIVCAEKGSKKADFSRFGLAALAMGLVRPEGVFMAFFMAAAIFWRHGRAGFGPKIAAAAAVAVPLGAAYFFGRWAHFGHPLPLPFYVKGRGAWHPENWLIAAQAGALLLFPLVPLVFAAFFSEKGRREAVFVGLPVVGFLAIWALLSNEMNWHFRFQYAVVPVGLMRSAALFEAARPTLAAFWERLERGFLALFSIKKGWKRLEKGHFLLAAGLVALLGQAAIFDRSRVNHAKKYSLADLGKALAEHREKGYRLATLEAGLLPFYSGWETLDGYGLNSPSVALDPSGGLTAAHLAAFSPDLIAFSAHFGPDGDSNLPTAWHRAGQTMRDFAEKNGYRKAACFTDRPRWGFYFWVKTSCLDAQKIADRIRAEPFFVQGRRLPNAIE